MNSSILKSVAVLILLLIGTVPGWPHSQGRGYVPSGLLGAVLIVMIVLLLMNRPGWCSVALAA